MTKIGTNILLLPLTILDWQCNGNLCTNDCDLCWMWCLAPLSTDGTANFCDLWVRVSSLKMNYSLYLITLSEIKTFCTRTNKMTNAFRSKPHQFR